MTFSRFNTTRLEDVINLFTHVFSGSEGEAEGRSIGQLVENLVLTTATEDFLGFVAQSENTLVGAIFFSRLTLPNGKLAFILSPVAIAINQQGQGLGQQLIRFGIEQLVSMDTQLLFTYGDPAFYGKVGFNPISEEVIQAPLPLSYPHGWLAQPLNGTTIEAMTGRCQCVSALNKQQYW